MKVEKIVGEVDLVSCWRHLQVLLFFFFFF